MAIKEIALFSGTMVMCIFFFIESNSDEDMYPMIIRILIINITIEAFFSSNKSCWNLFNMFTSILINQERNKIIHGIAINALNSGDYRKRQRTQKCVAIKLFLIYL